MSGGGRGKCHTGPISLKCPRCVKHEDYRGRRPSADHIIGTGAVKGPLWYHGKYLTMWQVKHETCGHVWWSKHSQARWHYEQTKAGR